MSSKCHHKMPISWTECAIIFGFWSGKHPENPSILLSKSLNLCPQKPSIWTWKHPNLCLENILACLIWCANVSTDVTWWHSLLSGLDRRWNGHCDDIDDDVKCVIWPCNWYLNVLGNVSLHFLTKICLGYGWNMSEMCWYMARLRYDSVRGIGKTKLTKRLLCDWLTE